MVGLPDAAANQDCFERTVPDGSGQVREWFACVCAAVRILARPLTLTSPTSPPETHPSISHAWRRGEGPNKGVLGFVSRGLRSTAVPLAN
jgi:hypothetical protein